MAVAPPSRGSLSIWPNAIACFGLAALACGAPGDENEPAPDPEPEPDRSDEFYGQELVDVAIELPAANWDALRLQARTRVGLLGGPMCSATPPPSIFEFAQASIAIDGERYEQVGIRKKGFGSQSSRKPSLKVHLGKFGGMRRHLSVKRFVLNNNKSDDTNMRQCLSYRLMTAAGLPAPRCTFARVEVNGEPLGVFTLLEEVKKPFLERHFGNSTGNLYEGESNDFRTEFIGLDQDNNEDTDDSRADLERVRALLAATSPESAPTDIATVIDLDGFYRHWASEVMIWHRDGYAGNINNYFVYADPTAGDRFTFIPWGTDNVLRNETRATVAKSTLAFGLLANLLYQNPEGRARFYAELDDLMATVWNEEDIEAWIDNKVALVEPHLRAVDVEAFGPELDAIKQTILDRRSVFPAARAGGDPDWEAGLRREICRIEAGTVSGVVTAQWDTLTSSNFAAGEVTTLEMTLDGQPVAALAASGAVAGIHATGVDYVGFRADTQDNERFNIGFRLPNPRFFDAAAEGITLPLESTAFFVGGAHVDQTDNSRLGNLEFDLGTFTATRFQKTDGGAIEVRFDANVYRR